MDWLLKHKLIKQYLQRNFKEKEWKRAVKYTLIIGIQTLHQLHGDGTTNPYSSITLEQLSSMIVSNSGTLQIQSDLPALSKCLKDIKSQLGDIQNELDSKPSPSIPKTQQFVKHVIESKKTKTKSVKAKQSKMQKKADSKWRNGDAQKQESNAIYPKWWPKDDEIEEEEEEEVEELESEVIPESAYPNAPQVQHPHIYNQPVAFSVPNQQSDSIQFHVNLYPEYLQKCLDPNTLAKIRNADDELTSKQQPIKRAKATKKSRSRSLTRCTESSQARAKGVRPQSAYLKSVNRDIAPCLKRKKESIPSKSSKKRKKKKRVKGSKPAYLRNVQSRIKKDLKRDKMRNDRIQNDKADLMQNIAKFGLNEYANDQYVDEWREQFGYSRLGRDEINKPSALSVADAMMQSEVIQGIDPSLNKKPTLITGNFTRFDDDKDETDVLYQDNQETNPCDESLSTNMNFLTDLRDWASGLVDKIESD